MRKPKQKSALQAIEDALELLRSASTLDGTAKGSVEVLLEVAVEKLRANEWVAWADLREFTAFLSLPISDHKFISTRPPCWHTRT